MAEQAEATGEDEGESPLEEIVSSAVIALTLLVAFGLMAAGVPYFWIAFVVGFAGVLPVSLGLVRYYEEQGVNPGGTAGGSETGDALEELRQRYARGELSDEEFERRVEHLLETESVYDAREYVERARDEPVTGGRTPVERSSGDTARESDRERESVRESE